MRLYLLICLLYVAVISQNTQNEQTSQNEANFQPTQNEQTNCHNMLCPTGFDLDSRTCECVCSYENLRCTPRVTFVDPTTCHCVCAASCDLPGHIQDPDTCECSCASTISECVVPTMWNSRSCECACPDLPCQYPARPNSRTIENGCNCQCEAICIPGAIQDPTTCGCSVVPHHSPYHAPVHKPIHHAPVHKPHEHKPLPKNGPVVKTAKQSNHVHPSHKH